MANAATSRNTLERETSAKPGPRVPGARREDLPPADDIGANGIRADHCAGVVVFLALPFKQPVGADPVWNLCVRRLPVRRDS